MIHLHLITSYFQMPSIKFEFMKILWHIVVDKQINPEQSKLALGFLCESIGKESLGHDEHIKDWIEYVVEVIKEKGSSVCFCYKFLAQIFHSQSENVLYLMIDEMEEKFSLLSLIFEELEEFKKQAKETAKQLSSVDRSRFSSLLMSFYKEKDLNSQILAGREYFMYEIRSRLEILFLIVTNYPTQGVLLKVWNNLVLGIIRDPSTDNRVFYLS